MLGLETTRVEEKELIKRIRSIWGNRFRLQNMKVASATRAWFRPSLSALNYSGPLLAYRLRLQEYPAPWFLLNHDRRSVAITHTFSVCAPLIKEVIVSICRVHTPDLETKNEGQKCRFTLVQRVRASSAGTHSPFPSLMGRLRLIVVYDLTNLIFTLSKTAIST